MVINLVNTKNKLIYTGLNSLVTTAFTVKLNNLQFSFNKGLSCISITIQSKETNTGDKRSSLHEFMSLKIPHGFLFITLAINILDKNNSCDVSDQRPTYRSPHFISLSLHKKFVSLVRKLVESNLRLVLILLL